MQELMLIQVALPTPLYRVFDYLIPDDLQNTKNFPKIGSRVCVPFGRQKLIGIVVAHLKHSNIAQNKLKPIIEVLDNQAIIDENLLQLAHWLARYYHYPIGDVFGVILPTLVRQGSPLEQDETFWRLLRQKNDHDFSAKATKEREQFALIEQHCQFDLANQTTQILESKLLEQGVKKHFLKKFAQKGLIESFTALPKLTPPPPVELKQANLTLNDEQKFALDKVVQAFNDQIYQGFLLNGVTGSGKTEVYLQVMQPILQQGKQVLILVPEIGLTPQTLARFSERFKANVLMLHSDLTDKVRLHGWQACRTGQAQIVIGTRSSIFYPFVNLGLIIVDESHDQSYKQQDTLRYHAGNVALYRGAMTKIPVILGTATPSLESLQLVNLGKLTELRLTKRAGNAKSAPIQLIDARQQKRTHGLAKNLINAMQKTLDKNEQVLVFLNRRGYAPILLCDACGWQADCPRCDAHLTVHLSPIALLKCHHCDWQNPIPKTCPDCGSGNIDPVGMGTARLTEGLGKIFTDIPIIQIDRDTTRRKDSWQKIYQQIADNPKAILVGTQMIAKGHHFPNVTLVAMPNADRGFLSADFRSPEHTAQLITQVAGRAGRADKQGRVLIQTLQPDNPDLLLLVRDGYEALARQLLSTRRLLGLPPIRFACLVRTESNSLEKNHKLLNDAKQLLPDQPTLIQMGLAVMGVIDAPMTKKNSRYHSQLLLLSPQRSSLHHLLNVWWEQVLTLPSAKYIKITLDIDPSGWG
ncbi:primosomal protein N' [Moraxella macacae 0408225]|uniref:Replication restart protein PriA n=1 Tax=Moraxella macacae 0408225 TaxID=1230338 RepID=L2F5F5_9GAMM|nr:primosomal protein N' [Moraxella macacae]ELA08110.1 primosomal protein N' [Moraxella macacae 0408225]